MSVDDVSAIGAYGMPMRFNITESMMLVTNTGAAYDSPNYRARTRNAFVNKPLIGMFRGVGIPLSTIVSEVLTDMAAAKLAVDPVAFKRLNYRKVDTMPCVTAAGSKLDNISFDACLDRLVQVMHYDRLRQEQAELREAGIHRGIGIATFVEPTAYGPVFYGPTGASISVQDGCTIRLEPTGLLRCVTSITDQGQGTIHSLAQVIADTLGVDIDDVAVIGGDSAISTYGGGAWASRGIAIGGEAAHEGGTPPRAKHSTRCGGHYPDQARKSADRSGTNLQRTFRRAGNNNRRGREDRIFSPRYAAARSRRPVHCDT